MSSLFTILLAASTVAVGSSRGLDVVLDHRLKWQNKNGSLEILLACNVQGNYPPNFKSHESCQIKLIRTIGRSSIISMALAHGPAYDLPICKHTVSVPNDGTPKQQRLTQASCGRRFRTSSTLRKWLGLAQNEVTGVAEAESPTILLDLLGHYLRRAIAADSHPAKYSTSEPRPLELTQGTEAKLYCRVINLQKWDEHSCEWTLSSDQGLLLVHAAEHRWPFGGKAVVGFNTELSSCQLNLSNVEASMAGNWTCTPGPGKDGWILPSAPIQIRITSSGAENGPRTALTASLISAGVFIIVIVIVVSGALFAKRMRAKSGVRFSSADRGRGETESEREGDPGTNYAASYRSADAVASIHPSPIKKDTAEDNIYQSLPERREDFFRLQAACPIYDWPLLQNAHET